MTKTKANRSPVRPLQPTELVQVTGGDGTPSKPPERQQLLATMILMG